MEESCDVRPQLATRVEFASDLKEYGGGGGGGGEIDISVRKTTGGHWPLLILLFGWTIPLMHMWKWVALFQKGPAKGWVCSVKIS